MGKIFEFEGVVPVVHPEAFVHPDAVVIGDVVIGPRCYIAPFASLRGDFGSIVLGAGASIQDGCCMHTFPGKSVILGAGAHVGHGGVLHGCEVRPGALVGMNAVVMDGAIVGEESIVGAMTLVKAGFKVPSGALVTGNPGKMIRMLSQEELSWLREGASCYEKLAIRSLASLRPVTPLAEVSGDRGVLPETGLPVPPFHEAR